LKAASAPEMSKKPG